MEASRDILERHRLKNKAERGQERGEMQSWSAEDMLALGFDTSDV